MSETSQERDVSAEDVALRKFIRLGVKHAADALELRVGNASEIFFAILAFRPDGGDYARDVVGGIVGQPAELTGFS